MTVRAQTCHWTSIFPRKTSCTRKYALVDPFGTIVRSCGVTRERPCTRWHQIQRKALVVPRPSPPKCLDCTSLVCILSYDCRSGGGISAQRSTSDCNPKLADASKETARLAKRCRSAAKLAAATRGTAARSRGRKHARLIRAVERSARAPKRRATHEQWHMARWHMVRCRCHERAWPWQVRRSRGFGADEGRHPAEGP